MSGDAMSTRDPLGLAERFVSFSAYAEWTSSNPQLAATSLDVARFHAFTGELAFGIVPEVRFFLDGGVVYHAHRDGDPSMTNRLLDAGVVDTVQLRRGVVEIGDVEHLGRLFERDPSVDRDAVMVVVERATEALVQLVANDAVASVTATAYRHPASGIHRWFVAPMESAPMRPPSTTASSSFAPPRGGDRPTAPPSGEFRVLWPDGSADDAIVPTPTTGARPPLGPPPGDAVPLPAPDPAARTDAERAQEVGPSPSVAQPSDRSESPGALAPPSTERTDAPEPVGFTLEPLTIDRLPEPDADVPDDVATAVRRALRAIETASPPAEVAGRRPEISLPEPQVPVTDPPPASAPAAPEGDEASVGPTPQTGFGPPTIDMRAEAVYARAAADTTSPVSPGPGAAQSEEAAADTTVDGDPAVAPDSGSEPVASPGRASVVFRDDTDDEQSDADDAPSDRTSALRRLIASLRNRDD